MRVTAFVLSCLTFLTIGTNSTAQNGTITGFVKDSDTKSPLTGASINLSVNNKADNADVFGSFRFTNVPAGQYELVATHIGYKTEIIPVEVKANFISAISVNMKKTGLDLSEVKLNSKKTNGLSTLGQVDIMLRPVNNSQDVLRMVPGLFIAQHAGGGKAEQIFLRGYDIDHGTDISLSVDGIPVNMVSHAHGQGYADLHFLIPETIEKVDFEMGPYSAEKGNLATAGYVDFKTKDFLTQNILKLEAGQFNTQRITALQKLLNKDEENKRRQLYIGTEYFRNDGFVESPQNFHRLNLLAKYNAWMANQSQLTITASAFDSKWDASGQIPERAVANGLISRLGFIDNSEGGYTGRYNFSVKYVKQLKNNWKTEKQLFYSRYRFNLWSNFTFFLEDSLNGDGINQKEERNMLGYNNNLSKTWLWGAKKVVTGFGAGFRMDDVNDISLSRSVKRQFLSWIQKGDVKETNTFLYWDQQVELTDRFTISGGLRYDHFRFGYKDELAAETSFRRQSRGIISPKLNFSYSPSAVLKIFLNNGIGFHSNDARVILNNEAKDILPSVYGTDLGIILKPAKNLVLKTTLWHLLSEQEFVYVGDAGIVEPGGKTRRIGVDLSARYQLYNWLFADLDINLTRARTIGKHMGENYIPLAPSFTSIGGLTIKLKKGLSGSLRYRFIDDRPANEDYSVKADGYFITDVTLQYRVKQFDFFISLENLFNREWNEAQFDTESRLQHETTPVSEIHFTPGTPRFFKAGVSFQF